MLVIVKQCVMLGSGSMGSTSSCLHTCCLLNTYGLILCLACITREYNAAPVLPSRRNTPSSSSSWSPTC